MMTKDEFIADYAKRFKMPIEDMLSAGLVIEPCDCDAGCERWQMVSRLPLRPRQVRP